MPKIAERDDSSRLFTFDSQKMCRPLFRLFKTPPKYKMPQVNNIKQTKMNFSFGGIR